MPFYLCSRADCVSRAHREESSPSLLSIKDGLGRDWLCAEDKTTEQSVDFPIGGAEILQPPGALFRKRLRIADAEVMRIACLDEAHLRRFLSCINRSAFVNEMVHLPSNIEGRGGRSGFVLELQEAPEAAPVEQEKPTMLLNIQAVPVPLRMDEHGDVRVGDSRFLLDALIREFHNGADPESIVHAYSVLRLEDVYAVIAFYLRNRKEVDDYLRAREAEADRLQQKIESEHGGQEGLRAKLLARKEQMEHASPGD
jgi:uncharacterized protein (DUF433 family)